MVWDCFACFEPKIDQKQVVGTTIFNRGSEYAIKLQSRLHQVHDSGVRHCRIVWLWSHLLRSIHRLLTELTTYVTRRIHFSDYFSFFLIIISVTLV